MNSSGTEWPETGKRMLKTAAGRLVNRAGPPPRHQTQVGISA